MSLTPEQLALRRTGVTATDISAICGLSPHKTPLMVWCDKVGEPYEKPDSEPMYWGRALEDDVLSRYARDHDGVEMGACGTIASDIDARWMCTPDSIASIDYPRVESWGVEAKTAFSYEQVKRWGTEGDQIPEEYIIQCQWSMMVCDLPRWDVAALLATYHGAEYREFTLEAAPDVQKALVAKAEEFWAYVVKKKEPPAVGLAPEVAALKHVYTDVTSDMRLAMAGDEDLASDYREAEQDKKDAEQRLTLAKIALVERIGDAEGIEDGAGKWKVTHKKSKRGRTFRATFK